MRLSHAVRLRGTVSAFLGACALALTPGGPAAAVDGLPGALTDTSGHTWQVLSHDEYFASAQVAQFDEVYRIVLNRDFVAAQVAEQEGETYRVDVTYADHVTRASIRDYQGRRKVTYVKGNRECTRTPARANQAGLKADTKASFTCGKAGRYAVRGPDVAATMAPSAEAPRGADKVYLVLDQQQALSGDLLARMDVVVMDPQELAHYGIDAVVPRTSYTYLVRADAVDTSVSAFNGYDSLSQWTRAASRGVPHLPSILGR